VNERIEALSSIDLFKGLGQTHMERIAAITEEMELKKNEVLFREGEAGDQLFAILEGQIRISRQIPGVGEEALAILGPGDYFGEMAIFDDAPRSGDALAHESCRLLTLSKPALQDLMFTDFAFAHEVLWNLVRTLSDRLRRSNEKMTFMAVTGRF
jgi:CRP-like cAMP-binding protein